MMLFALFLFPGCRRWFDEKNAVLGKHAQRDTTQIETNVVDSVGMRRR